MVTWKSASTSSRNASNASSARSSSSISSTGAPAVSGSSACSSGRLIRKRSENTSCSMPLAVVLAFGLGDADRDHLRGVVPLVDRRRHVEPFVALQADQPAPERRRQHLGDLGLADAGLAFEEERPAHAQRQEQHGRERAVGEIVGRRRAARASGRWWPGAAGARVGFIGACLSRPDRRATAKIGRIACKTRQGNLHCRNGRTNVDAPSICGEGRNDSGRTACQECTLTSASGPSSA